MDWAYDAYDEDAAGAARDAVAIDEPWALIERFADLVRESGSEDERRAAAYLVERLETLGIPHTVHEPELYLSVPREAALTLPGDPRETACKTPAFSASTGAAGLEATIVEVEADDVVSTESLFSASARIDRADLEGRIAVLDGYAMPKIVRQLESAGAVAAIFVNPGHAHEGIVTTIWGTPSLSERQRIPEIPVVAVSRDTGAELRARIRSGADEVRLRTDLFRGWVACPLVVAEIEGRRPEFVLVHGHYDSWHEGIGDNAVGDAALLEIARVTHGLRERLQRGVRVAWWPAHSTGRYAGSTWYADRFAMELRDRCVAQIDVDSPGCRWATAYDEVMWMAEAGTFASRVIRDVTGIEPAGIRPLRAGDYSFNQIGLTGFFMLLSNIPEEVAEQKGFYPVGGCGGNSDAWHTEGDTLEVADRDNLHRDIRVYVEAIVRLATAPFLPFDYRATVEEIAGAARRYAEAAEGSFDAEPLLTECRALLEDLDAFHEKARERLQGRAVIDDLEVGAYEDDLELQHAALIPFDRIQVALGRELIPAAYTLERRYHHDPAVDVPPLPDLAVLRRWPDLEDDEDGRRFLLAEAVRGRNRVVDALKRARERLAFVLG